MAIRSTFEGPGGNLLENTSNLSTEDWFVRNRLFSFAGIILNEKQCRLSDLNVGMLACRSV